MANKVEIVVVATDRAGRVFDQVRRKAEKAGKDAGEDFGREADGGVRRAFKGAKLGTEMGASVGKTAVEAIGSTFGSLPGEIKGPLIAGLALAAAAAAPVLGASVAAAVIGGAGIGGVIGGVLLVKDDPRVKTALTGLGQSVSKSLRFDAAGFTGPVILAADIAEKAFLRSGGNIQRFFGAAATWVTPLATALGSVFEDVSGGLADLLNGAGAPVLQALTKGLEQTGTAVKSVLQDLASVGPEAAGAVNLAFGLLNGTLIVLGGTVKYLAQVWGTAQQLQLDLLPDVITENERLLGVVSPMAAAYQAAGGAIQAATQAVADNARTVGENAVAAYEAARAELSALSGSLQTVKADAEGVKTSLQGLADQLRAQTDPTFALIEAQQRLKEAQTSYNTAVKEHGADSEQAKTALLELARAAIAMQDATSSAAGTFDGKLSPAMRATLHAAGLSEAAINALEREMRQAQAAGQAFAKTYKATVTQTGAEGAAARIRAGTAAGKEYARRWSSSLVLSGSATVVSQARSAAAAIRAVPSRKDVLITIRTVGATPKGLATGGVVGAESTQLNPRRRSLRHAAEGGPQGGSDVLVGEAGPEIVNLPFGSQVTPAGASRTRLDQAAAAGDVSVRVEFSGGLDTMFATFFQKALQAGLIRIRSQYITA